MTRVVRIALLGALTSLSSLGACGVDEIVLRVGPAELFVDGGGNPPFDGSSGGPNNVYAVALGEGFTCALVRGVAFCWGTNVDGELGIGGAAIKGAPTPIPVKGDRLFDALSAGYKHACGLESGTGNVLCWGNGSNGQLGQGNTNPSFEPVPVRLQGPAAAIAAGHLHSCAILKIGELYCWGLNGEGELGQNDAVNSPDILKPVRVGTDADWIAISGGQGHTCGLRKAANGGTLWCWGRNNAGQVGIGPSTPETEQVHVPTQVGALEDWKSIDLGQYNACGIPADGSLRCWGISGDARLNGTPDTLYVPTTIGTDHDWANVNVGAFTVCGVTTGNTLRCWGRNNEGAVGVGDAAIEEVLTPTLIPGAWSQVGVGQFHMCAVGTDHMIACTGENDRGQLGDGVADGGRQAALTPVILPSFGVQ